MENITDLNQYRFEKGLEALNKVAIEIEERREDLYFNFMEAFDLDEDEDVEDAVECVWDSCVSAYLQPKTLQGCIRAEIKLMGYYSEFGELLHNPYPWIALAGDDA